jgi:two-component system invasion response regulator UvrY
MRTWRDRLPQPGTPLSPRELEVLALVAEGLSNPDIGREAVLDRGLGQDPHPADRGPLGARNRAHVVWLAVQRGYLELPESPHGGDEQ